MIFTVAMLLIPRYGGYMNTDWNSEVEIGSGLGVLIRLSIPFVIFFFRKKLLEQNPKKSVSYIIKFSLCNCQYSDYKGTDLRTFKYFIPLCGFVQYGSFVSVGFEI